MTTELELVIAKESHSPKSYKKDCYFTAPLKIGEPKSENDRLHIVCMMASAGILKGDEFSYKITCEKDTKVLITEQSYSKLFDMGDSGISFRHMDINVEKNASLWYRPCAVVPFRNSCFSSTADIRVEDGAELLWTDIFTAGRVGMGEKFAFRHYDNCIKVWYGERLVWLDKCVLNPSHFEIENIFYYRNYTHQGTCYYCGNHEKERRLLNTDFSKIQYEHIYIGMTQAKKGVCIRVLGNQSQDIEELFDHVNDIIKG